LIHYFRGHDRAVQPGEPWPIVDSPARYYPVPTGNPQNRGRAAERGEWLALVPEYTAGLEIRLRWCGPHLPVLRRGSRVAVGVVASNVEDFEFDRLSPNGVARFYGMRPRVPDYWARIEAVLAHCHLARAEVLVLPELSLTEALHARLLAHPLVAKIPLLVAGSRHVERVGEAPGRNVTTVIARGRVLAEHAKLADFFFRDNGVERFEHIDPGGIVTMLVSDRASALVLICKDLLRADWQHLTAQLAPRLLLVPSMTHEYGDFTAFAERMARDPQAHTIMANIGPVAALIGRPSREDTVITMNSEIGRCIIYAIGEPGSRPMQSI
jgi:predicted amidohydrolase